MKRSKPITFFGSDEFSARILQALLDAGWPLALIVTKPRRRKGRGKKDTSQPVLDIAEGSEVPVLAIEHFDDTAIQQLAAHRTEVAVLASFGLLVPKTVLELYPVGIINVHPSLLPRWRGASPVEAAILHGDGQTGVSLMRLVSEMDAGPLFAQAEIVLTGQETQRKLSEKLAIVGTQLLLEELPEIVKDTTKPKPQPSTGVTYAPRISKQDAVINWQDAAEDIERRIRAYQDWPQARAQLYGQQVAILSARVVNEAAQTPEALAPGQPFVHDKKLYVQTGKGLLHITRIKPAGKQAMDETAFINGYVKKAAH